jgi:hypothetical protein
MLIICTWCPSIDHAWAERKNNPSTIMSVTMYSCWNFLDIASFTVGTSYRIPRECCLSDFYIVISCLRTFTLILLACTARPTWKTKSKTSTRAIDVFLNIYGIAGSFPFAVIRFQSSWTKSMVRGNREDIHTRSEPSDSWLERRWTHAFPSISSSLSGSPSSTRQSITAFTQIRHSRSTTTQAQKRAELCMGSSPEAIHSWNRLCGLLVLHPENSGLRTFESLQMMRIQDQVMTGRSSRDWGFRRCIRYLPFVLELEHLDKS